MNQVFELKLVITRNETQYTELPSDVERLIIFVSTPQPYNFVENFIFPRNILFLQIKFEQPQNFKFSDVRGRYITLTNAILVDKPPSETQSLELFSCDIQNNLPFSMPINLLYLINCNYHRSIIFNHDIKQLCITNINCDMLSNLPRGLEQLTILNSTIRAIGKLPANLQSIILENVQELPEIPFNEGIKELTMINSAVQQIANVPDSIEKIILENPKFSKVGKKLQNIQIFIVNGKSFV